MLQWLRSLTKEASEHWLFYGEHTGLYSVILSEFLIKKGLFMWLENPLQIKRSTGLKRAKSDKIDSRDIAMYACRFSDKARSYHLPDKTLRALEILFAFRERLKANKHNLLVSAAELRRVMHHDTTARFIYEQSQKDIERLNNEIKTVEKRMLEQIETSAEMSENYNIISSVKGIAKINTIAILIATQNFTRFENSRQFACYTGMAPFGKQPGTSLHTKPHVSHLADKRIKTLLTQAVKCAIKHDSNIRQYWLRKMAEGKNEWLIINNLRNKMIHRIFAMVRNKECYFVNNLKKD